MDNRRHGIRASGDYAIYNGSEYFGDSFRDRVRLLCDDDPLPPGFQPSTMTWVRGEAVVPRSSVERLFRVRTICRWRGHRFEVGIVLGDTANVTYLDGAFGDVSGLPGMSRPDKYEVIGKVPVSELTEVEEYVEVDGTADDFADTLRSRIRTGDGLSVPYARRWDVGGCVPDRDVRSYPYDGLRILGTGLEELGRRIFTAPDRLIVERWPRDLWVAASRSLRSDGPPDAYLVGTDDLRAARYVGDAAEVVVEILREELGLATGTPPDATDVHVGFPGLPQTTTTYVGSWRWNVHGEAADKSFVRRATSATLRVIDAKKITQEP